MNIKDRDWVRKICHASQQRPLNPKGAYHAYNPTDEIDAVLRKANYAETDKELEEWGGKISQTIRESMINTVLWANHRAHALGPKIKSWSPCIGADPAIDYDTIEINK